MGQPNSLIHRSVPNAAIPYAPSQNPISESPSLNAGADLIAVIDPLSSNGWVERRPGWDSKYESGTASTPWTSIQRIYGWRRWNAHFYVMLSVTEGGVAKVYYYDNSSSSQFTALFTSSSAEPFDFTVSDNTLYFSNGTESKKWDGTTLTKWGIAAPTFPPNAGVNTVAGTGPLTASFGYRFGYDYANSSTGHHSTPVNNPNSTGTFSKGYIYVVGDYSADTQVDQIHVYRTTDGGDGTYFEKSTDGAYTGSIANVPGNINSLGQKDLRRPII